MVDEIEVTVKLRWEGCRLTCPLGNAGHIGGGRTGWYWSMMGGFGTNYGGPLTTEAEAKRAVEAAAIKALKGNADE
jgi:hypothetical protein